MTYNWVRTGFDSCGVYEKHFSSYHVWPGSGERMYAHFLFPQLLFRLDLTAHVIAYLRSCYMAPMLHTFLNPQKCASFSQVRWIQSCGELSEDKGAKEASTTWSLMVRLERWFDQKGVLQLYNKLYYRVKTRCFIMRKIAPNTIELTMEHSKVNILNNPRYIPRVSLYTDSKRKDMLQSQF